MPGGNDGSPSHIVVAVKACAVAACVTAIATSLFLALAYAVASIDKRRLGDRLLAAQADSELSRTIRVLLLRPGVSLPVWDDNSCMILYMLVAPGYTSRWQEAVSPLVPTGAVRCTELAKFLKGEAIPDGFYHRYLHGYRVVTAAMLVIMPVAAVPFVLLIALHLVALSLVVVAFVRLRRARDRFHQRVPMGFLAIGLSLLLFWGLPRAAISISFGFGDAVVIAMPLIFLLCNPLRMSERSFLLLCATFGAFDAWFEFLTGQTPLMLALIPGCLAVSCETEADAERLWPRLAGGLTAFAATALGCLLLKWVIAVANFGGYVAFETLMMLGKSTIGSPQPSLPDSVVSVLHWLAGPLITAVASAPIFGFGSPGAGTAIMTGSIVAAAAGLWTYRCRATTPAERGRMMALTLSLAVLASWYVVFLPHFIAHASYMVRPLVWITCVAGIIWPDLWLKRQDAYSTEAPQNPIANK